jgi:DNA (cytosine-5)-methyltransferase 1
MRAYYNEIDKYCAGWLRNLASASLIPDGDVDERPIEQVSPNDLKTYTQCHFFAGIAGWPLALRLARWGDGPVWTGSCPCQPFSGAGRREGRADRRHLWPEWFRLIRQCRPPVVFGEQVAAAITFGWLDEVFHDLEAEGYACGAAVLPACGIGAPHRRDRIYFVADANGDEYSAAKRRGARSAAKAAQDGPSGGPLGTGNAGGGAERSGSSDPLQGSDGIPAVGAVGDADEPGSQGRDVLTQCPGERPPWSAGLEWIAGQDGKWRPVESGIRPLADGVPARVGKLRAYGNAIVPQLAAEFIRAYGECMK